MAADFDAYYKWLAIPPAEQPPNHYRLLGLPLFEADQEVIAAAAVQRFNWVRKFETSAHADLAHELAREIKAAWKCLNKTEKKLAYDVKLRGELENLVQGSDRSKGNVSQLSDLSIPEFDLTGIDFNEPLPPAAHDSQPRRDSAQKAEPELRPIALPPDVVPIPHRMPTEPKVSAPLPPMPVPPPLPAAQPVMNPTAHADVGNPADDVLEVDFSTPPSNVPHERKERKKKPFGVQLAKHVAASLAGLALGYAILCLIGRQYDFLGLLPKADADAKPAVESLVLNTLDHSSQSDDRAADSAPRKPRSSDRKNFDNGHGSAATIGQADEPAATDGANPTGAMQPLPNGLFPVPTADEQARAEQQMNSIPMYRALLHAGAATPGGFSILAKRKLDAAKKLAGDVVVQYVFLSQAKDNAAQGGDTETVLHAIDALSELFAVDALELKAGALSIVASETKQAKTLIGLAAVLDNLLIDAVAASRFDLAQQIATSAAYVAGKLRFADKLVRNRPVAESEITDADYMSLASALEKLAKDANAAQPNAEVGVFLCLVKNNWEMGAPILARGGSDLLKSLAAKEAKPPEAAADQLALADQWWDAAQAEQGLMAFRMRQRTVNWYIRANRELAGEDRARAEMRIDEGLGRARRNSPRRPLLPRQNWNKRRKTAHRLARRSSCIKRFCWMPMFPRRKKISPERNYLIGNNWPRQICYAPAANGFRARRQKNRNPKCAN